MAEIGESLSERELAVLECLADGSTNREIAQNLHISHNTVKVHLRNIFTKLDVSSRTEATAVALQKGLLSLPGLESTAESEEEADSADSNLRGDQAGSTEIRTVDTAGTESGAQTFPVGRWRTISLALGGLLILVLVILVGVQFLENRGSGGQNGETTDAVEVPIGDTRWYTIPPLPRPISNLALATVGLNLYQIGGEVEAGVVNLVNIYETDSGQWMAGAPKTTAVADATAAVVFGEIYVPGGRLADGRPTSVVEAYSPANNAWRPVAALPKPISGGLALSDGSLLYLFGGWDGTDYLPDVYVYNPTTDIWESLPSMTTGRAFAAGGILSGNLYIAGGQNGDGDLAVCEYYEPGQAVWQNCPEMAHSRSGAGGAVLANHWLYIFGGSRSEETIDSEAYNVETGEWQTVDMPMLEDRSWSNLAVSTVETRIFVIGGRQGDEIQSSGYAFAPFVFQTFLPAVGADE